MTAELSDARQDYRADPGDAARRARLAGALVARSAEAADASAVAELEALVTRHADDPDLAEHLACAHFNLFQHLAWVGAEAPTPSAPARFAEALRWRDALAALGHERNLPFVHQMYGSLLQSAVENRAQTEGQARAAADLTALLRRHARDSDALSPDQDPLTYFDALEAHARAHDAEQIRWALHEALTGLVFQWSEAGRSARRDALLARLRRRHAARPEDPITLELLAVGLSAAAREALARGQPAEAAQDELRRLHDATSHPFVATQLAEALVELPTPAGLDEVRALVARHPGHEALRTLLDCGLEDE